MKFMSHYKCEILVICFLLWGRSCIYIKFVYLACILIHHIFIHQAVILSLPFSWGLIRYKQAAFCYEELILSQPTNPLYHLAYADVSCV